MAEEVKDINVLRILGRYYRFREVLKEDFAKRILDEKTVPHDKKAKEDREALIIMKEYVTALNGLKISDGVTAETLDRYLHRLENNYRYKDDSHKLSKYKPKDERVFGLYIASVLAQDDGEKKIAQAIANNDYVSQAVSELPMKLGKNKSHIGLVLENIELYEKISGLKTQVSVLLNSNQKKDQEIVKLKALYSDAKKALEDRTKIEQELAGLGSGQKELVDQVKALSEQLKTEMESVVKLIENAHAEIVKGNAERLGVGIDGKLFVAATEEEAKKMRAEALRMLGVADTNSLIIANGKARKREHAKLSGQIDELGNAIDRTNGIVISNGRARKREHAKLSAEIAGTRSYIKKKSLGTNLIVAGSSIAVTVAIILGVGLPILNKIDKVHANDNPPAVGVTGEPSDYDKFFAALHAVLPGGLTSDEISGLRGSYGSLSGVDSILNAYENQEKHGASDLKPENYLEIVSDAEKFERYNAFVSQYHEYYDADKKFSKDEVSALREIASKEKDETLKTYFNSMIAAAEDQESHTSADLESHKPEDLITEAQKVILENNTILTRFLVEFNSAMQDGKIDEQEEIDLTKKYINAAGLSEDLKSYMETVLEAGIDGDTVTVETVYKVPQNLEDFMNAGSIDAMKEYAESEEDPDIKSYMETVIAVYGNQEKHTESDLKPENYLEIVSDAGKYSKYNAFALLYNEKYADKKFSEEDIAALREFASKEEDETLKTIFNSMIDAAEDQETHTSADLESHKPEDLITEAQKVILANNEIVTKFMADFNTAMQDGEIDEQEATNLTNTYINAAGLSEDLKSYMETILDAGIDGDTVTVETVYKVPQNLQAFMNAGSVEAMTEIASKEENPDIKAYMETVIGVYNNQEAHSDYDVQKDMAAYGKTEAEQYTEFVNLLNEAKNGGLTAEEKATLEGYITKFSANDNASYGYNSTGAMNNMLDTEWTVSTLNGQVAGLQSDLSAANNLANNLQTQVNTLTADNTNLEQKLLEVSGDLTNLDDLYKKLQNDYNNLVGEYNKLLQSGSASETELANLRAEIVSLKGQISSMNSKLSGIYDALGISSIEELYELLDLDYSESTNGAEQDLPQRG